MHRKNGCHQIAAVELICSSGLVALSEIGEYQPKWGKRFK